MTDVSDRRRLTLVVWGVLIAQLFLYPGLEDTLQALGANPAIDVGMWFLVAEYAAVISFAVVWGVASDSIGKRVPLVIVGSVGAAATYILIAVSPTFDIGFTGILLLRAIGGAFIVGAFSLSITMLMDLPGGNGRNMGAAGAAIGFGAAVGSIIGGTLAEADPLAPLYAGAVVFLGCAVIAATITDTAPGTTAKARDIIKSVRNKPQFAVPYAFGFIDRLTAGFFALTGVFYFRDAFEIGAAQAGVTLALFFIPFAALQYHLGTASDKSGRFAPIIVGSALYGTAIIAVGLAPTYHLAAALLLLVGVCGALVSPTTMALVTDIASPDERGAAMGGFNIAGSLGFLIGFLVGGIVTSTYGFLPAFLVVGGLEIVAAIVLARPVARIVPRPDEENHGLLSGEQFR